ncbi:type II/IV secretion system protein [Candidatus Microgenomates bacterium]|nr:type II/IV secretion system protein [Candidatus Microgenomates bacterium]
MDDKKNELLSTKKESFLLELKIKQILEKSGLIAKKDLEKAAKIASQKGKSLYEIILDKNLITDEVFGKTIADNFGLPFINLSKTKIETAVLKIIPEIVAKKQKIIAFSKDSDGLKIAIADPTNLEAIELVKKKTGEKIILYYATEIDIKDILSLYQKEIKEEFSSIIKKSAVKVKGVKGEIVEPPIVKIVDTVLSYANQNKSSDIHIEPQEEKALVRFRIDGILHDIISIPMNIYPQIATRIKVMANLRTDEHQKPQDGKLVFREKDLKLDVRVSFVPTVNGEKIVMRLLSDQARQFSLESLGMGQKDLEKVERAFKKPYGLILSTGPTGCGKTTSQYAILKILNQRDVNIMTIEDPVEYDIEDINQIQINTRAGLSFASGLRSIVRQDPDIVLIGEIRDKETAKIAVNSAMTGHLVLSTLHTNDAATSLPRLLDMEIEPFLVASTVTVIIAQRLARKICTRCVESVEIKKSREHKNKRAKEREDKEVKEKEDLSVNNVNKTMEQLNQRIFSDLSPELIKRHFGDKNVIRVYRGKGCDVCHQTGYTGRVGIFEVLEMNKEIRQAIVDRADAEKIRDLAIKSGMTAMIDDGLKKVAAGVTTIEELLRVIKE